MTGYEFIFSDKLQKRFYRHVVFWALLALHFIIQNLIVGTRVNEAMTPHSFMDSSLDALFFFPIYILSVYAFIDFVLPAYLFPRRYLLFFCWTISLLIVDFTSCFFSGALYMHLSTHIPFDKITFDRNEYNAIVNGLFLPIVILGVSGGIKLSKKWYIEQKENERLAKEKIARELQILKTQLHPRFLFHSLHTVKKHIGSNSALAANLILHLSDLLSYILYESKQELVLLDKELEIIKSYIDLEKKSSSDRLSAALAISGITSGKYISPFLLLSAVETSFNYYLKYNQNDPSVEMSLRVCENHLEYQLRCKRFSDKYYNRAAEELKSIDLEKQLQYVYPGLHAFEITARKLYITIALRMPLYREGIPITN